MNQCTAIFDGNQCIYANGHGGDNYAPQDGQDHSDEIRIRLLRDERDKLMQRVLELEDSYKKTRLKCIETQVERDKLAAQVEELTTLSINQREQLLVEGWRCYHCG